MLIIRREPDSEERGDRSLFECVWKIILIEDDVARARYLVEFLLGLREAVNGNHIL